MANIPQLLLAAGASSRMGTPKAILSWGLKTVIEHRLDILLQTKQSVAVVLGADAHLIKPYLKNYEIPIFINKDWSKGLGNSIAFGVKEFQSLLTSADGLLLSLVDQPLIPLEHFNKMIHRYETQSNPIIVSHSKEGWMGVPVLFDRIYFSALENLTADDGGKKVMQQFPQNVYIIEGGDYLDDMDTPEVYHALLKRATKEI
jgi:molybdenum cofactor cytidylyltransferase